MNKSQMESYWKYHIENAKKNGVSKAEYCKSNKLSEKQFYYWQRKLADNNIKKTKEEKKESKFIQVKVKEKDNNSSEIIMKLPHGVTLEGNKYPEPKWVANLLLSIHGKPSC